MSPSTTQRASTEKKHLSLFLWATRARICGLSSRENMFISHARWSKHENSLAVASRRRRRRGAVRFLLLVQKVLWSNPFSATLFCVPAWFYNLLCKYASKEGYKLWQCVCMWTVLWDIIFADLDVWSEVRLRECKSSVKSIYWLYLRKIMTNNSIEQSGINKVYVLKRV